MVVLICFDAPMHLEYIRYIYINIVRLIHSKRTINIVT